MFYLFKIRNAIHRTCLLLIILGILGVDLRAEGTKQIQPDPSKPCKLNLFNPDLTKFASYSASEAERLHISIKNPGNELIYLGFGQTFKGTALTSSTVITNVYFRVRDPQGNIVYGPALVPTTGAGFISSYSQAVNGPAPVAVSNGYTPLTLQPTLAGDYYIEFNPGDPEIPVSGYNNDFKFDLFDITVANKATQQAIKGRLWSKTWDLNVLLPNNAVNAQLYTYTSDGIVTRLSLNGIQPYGFTVACNATGLENTGDLTQDRKSAKGKKVYPEFKIFLNDPDETLFPSGTPVSLNVPAYLSQQCPGSGYQLLLQASGAAYADVYIEVNDTAGYQPRSRDVKFDRFIVQGKDSLAWSGKDGLGNPIPKGSAVKVFVNLVTGLTNFPIYDAEFNVNGLKVDLIRPLPTGTTTPQPVALFWDDSNLPDGTQNFAGCLNSVCHAWNKGPNDQPSANSGYGNERTINTWWGSISAASNFGYQIADCPVNQPPVARPDAVEVSENSGPVTVDMNANNSDPERNLDLGSTQIIVQPLHGTASVQSGTGLLTYTPEPAFSGRDTVIVRVCDKGNPALCTPDTLLIKVKSLDPVSKVVIPEGFSPNGDGTNDFFEIINPEEVRINLTIYNRWGTAVYTNSDYRNEWNGTANGGFTPAGRELPDGTYYYVIYLNEGPTPVTRYLTLKR